MKNPLIFHRKKFDSLGDSFYVQSAKDTGFLLSRNPIVINHVLQKNHKNYEKSTIQTVDLAKYVGHGILTTNGNQWLVHRRMIQPGFSKTRLKNVLVLIKNTIEEEVNRIVENRSGDIFPTMSDLAFQVVARSLFSVGDIRKDMQGLQEITFKAQDMLIKELRQPYLKWWFNLSGAIKKHVNLANDAKQIVRSFINRRRDEGENHDDILDMLMNATYEDDTYMADDQLIDEVMILFTAGHETTANALSFVFHFIGSDPLLQNRILEEVNAFDFEQEDLMSVFTSFPLIMSAVNEAMRMYPPAYVIDRIAKEDDVIDGIKIKKGQMVLLSIYELHRNETYWNQPSTYMGDRFLALDKKDYSKYFYPFGAGPRMCVGNHFANFEMIMTVATIIKKIKLESSLKEVEVKPMISLKPERVPIRFVKR